MAVPLVKRACHGGVQQTAGRIRGEGLGCSLRRRSVQQQTTNVLFEVARPVRVISNSDLSFSGHPNRLYWRTRTIITTGAARCHAAWISEANALGVVRRGWRAVAIKSRRMKERKCWACSYDRCCLRSWRLALLNNRTVLSWLQASHHKVGSVVIKIPTRRSLAGHCTSFIITKWPRSWAEIVGILHRKYGFSSLRLRLLLVDAGGIPSHRRQPSSLGGTRASSTREHYTACRNIRWYPLEVRGLTMLWMSNTCAVRKGNMLSMFSWFSNLSESSAFE